MELFAFCQPLTFISKPFFAFYTSSSISVTRLVSSFCLWPFLSTGSRFKLRSPPWFLNQSSIYCMHFIRVLGCVWISAYI